eukprot:g14523.t1
MALLPQQRPPSKAAEAAHPSWLSYCAKVQKSRSGAFVGALRQLQASHKGCRSKHSTNTHSSHTHSSNTHSSNKHKKKGKGFWGRAGDALDWYNKHSLLEEGSTTEAKANCFYTLSKGTNDGLKWGTLRVHFVTPTSLSYGQQYPVRGPWRIDQANPSQKYRQYLLTTGITEPGKNYIQTFQFTGKYAQQEMELNGISSTSAKHVKDCGQYFCMESGAPIHN